MRILDIGAAAACLAGGGLVIYPTETFYALGCRADCVHALGLVYQLKGRPANRPLALVAADARQAGMAADLGSAPPELLREFWPGPLSVVLRALPGLDARVAPAGMCALRVPGCALTRRLARGAGFPLTSSSANLSGESPAADLADIDQGLVAALEKAGAGFGLLPATPGDCPSGGLPSTLVLPRHLPDGAWRLEILRQGAVGAGRLQRLYPVSQATL